MLTGDLRGRQIEVESDSICIGKSRRCDVSLPDDTVSRQHAEIHREAGGYRFRDLGSTNGSYVGGARVKDAYLKPGDVLGIGKVQLRFMPRDAPVELLPSERESFGDVVGVSLQMRQVFGVLERIANTDVTVLMEGETGTGKHSLARALHQASGRREGPFIGFDCESLSAEQLEAELFGADRAGEGRAGAFELAAGGTLFLDDVHAIPLDVQAKVLRVLETQRLRRVGGAQEYPVNARIVVATQQDLRRRVETKEFRDDLFFRLSVVSVVVPPLRERRDDIPRLIEYFSRRLPPGMWKAPDPEAMARLVGYDWPGNVRELRNVVERSAYLSPTGGIDLVTSGTETTHHVATFDPTLTFREQKERVTETFEAAYLAWLLERAQGNISRAAREADMDRKYLHKLLRRYGIDAKRFARRDT